MDEKLVKLAYAVLPSLKRRIIAVKFIKSEEKYLKINATELLKPINYCQIVKASTSSGKVIKVRENMLKCRSGARALGLEKNDQMNENGENWTRLGLHKNSNISKKIRENVEYIKENIKGILISPIEKIKEYPDVIIIIGNPYTMMRIAQGYTYAFGRMDNINIMGNQAICLESTSRPFLYKDTNISLLCIGTRHLAGWADQEMSVGIPIEQFEQIIEGVFKTVNIMENNDNKKEIDKNLEKLNIDYNIIYSYNYYMDILK